MRIYNTLSEQKDELSPRDSDAGFRFFVCGPTVQDNIHLGHAKTYFTYDVLTRWLLKQGNKVLFLMNITDIDDKIFDRAAKEGSTYQKIADRFYDEFVEDLESLNILTVSKFSRVSKYITESAQLVRRLLDSGYAYSLSGNTYFDTSKADRFGKLSHQSEYELKMKQIDAAPGKRNSVDFLLWRKVEGAKEGIWNYDSVGPGRPGWHIQDSAIAFGQFSGPYDLHGGATELIFPHHESELAQDEALSGRIPFVSIWMHTGLLLKDGEKMSKSLGNMVTVREGLKRFSVDGLRLYFLRHHYRSSFNLDENEISESSRDLAKLSKAASMAPRPQNLKDRSSFKLEKQKDDALKDFTNAMDDDLQTPKAIEILLESADRILDAGTRSEKEELARSFWHMVDCLGFTLEEERK